MEGNDNLDSFFKSKLEDGQADVPASSWQAISQKVSDEKKQKRGFIIPIPFFWIAASFLMGSVAGAVSFYAYELKTENEKLRTLLYPKSPLINTSNNTGSGFYNSAQSSQNGSLTISNNSFEKLNNKYTFGILAGSKAEQASFGSFPHYSPERIRKNIPRIDKPADKHNVSGVNYTGTNPAETEISAPPHSGSEINTFQAFNSNAVELPKTMDGQTNVKSGKPDSLIVKPDSVIKIASPVKTEEENKIKKAVRVFGFPISVGIYVTPEMASRSINFSPETDPELVKYKQKDERKFGFSAGLNMDIHLPKNFFIRTGINYWNVGEKNTVLLKHTEYDTTTSITTSSNPNYTTIKVGQITPGNANSFDTIHAYNGATYNSGGSGQVFKVQSSDITTNSSTNVTESVSQFSSTISNNYHYLGIPVLVGMKMSNRKLSFGLFSGLITNVLLSPSSSIYYVYYNPEQPEKFVQAKRELSRFLLVYSGGMDFDYRIGKQWTVNVSPTIKYAMTSIYKDASVKQLPYSFGVQFGVKYRIGN